MTTATTAIRVTRRTVRSLICETRSDNRLKLGLACIWDVLQGSIDRGGARPSPRREGRATAGPGATPEIVAAGESRSHPPGGRNPVHPHRCRGARVLYRPPLSDRVCGTRASAPVGLLRARRDLEWRLDRDRRAGPRRLRAAGRAASEATPDRPQDLLGLRRQLLAAVGERWPGVEADVDQERR